MGEIVVEQPKPEVNDADIELSIKNDTSLPSQMFAEAMRSPEFLAELVTKKKAGEALYEGEPTGEEEKEKKPDESGAGDEIKSGEGEGEGDGKDAEKAGKTEEKDEGKKRSRSGYRRKAEKAIERADALERELAELRREVASGKTATGKTDDPDKKPEVTTRVRPKQDDFKDYDEYLEALADFKVDAKLDAREAKNAKEGHARDRQQEAVQFKQKVATALETQAKAGMDLHDDWQEVVEKVDEAFDGSGTEWADAHMYAFATSGRAGEIAYHLGQNIETAEKLVGIRNRDKFLLEIGKILTVIDAKAKKEEKKDEGSGDDTAKDKPSEKKDLPKPMERHLGGAATPAAKDDDYYANDASPSEFAEEFMKKRRLR